MNEAQKLSYEEQAALIESGLLPDNGGDKPKTMVEVKVENQYQLIVEQFKNTPEPSKGETNFKLFGDAIGKWQILLESANPDPTIEHSIYIANKIADLYEALDWPNALDKALSDLADLDVNSQQ